MPRVLVIHWNGAEAAERVERLCREGFEAGAFTGQGSASLRQLWDNPPDAVVIDLARLPSQGRDLGIALRGRKATRMVPLLFIQADAEKTARVREVLPDAVFTSWPDIGAALRQVLQKTREGTPVVPGVFAGYSGTPLNRKLRIREGSTVALLHAPEGFETRLAPLPEGARLQQHARQADVILAFMKSAAALERALPSLARSMCQGRTLWLIWPKRTSALAGDLSEPLVRRTGLAAGLVDYKVCAVDETWSGLAFAARRADAGRK